MSETSLEAGSGSGKYRTLFELGQGGTANVSLAVAKGPEGFKKLFVVKQLRILADVLSGLHYSHELRDLKHEPLNVVHRDVSPHNVMVSYEGVVKVLDF